jgi:tRNA/rRNA methyltransferase
MTVRTRFVLVETSHAGNVGAVARAMKVMGFDDLVLVRPRWPDVLQHQEALDRASGANDVLANSRVVQDLHEALDGITHVCATAMTPRDFGPPTRSPREHLPMVAAVGQQGVAFVFGSERYGMRNEDVYRCHVCLRIPTVGDYGSLNIAAALQLVAYEWRLALNGAEQGATYAHSSDSPVRADAAAVAGLLQHWEQALVQVGYLDPAAPKKLMPRLQQLFYRAQVSTEEIHILRGVAKAMLETAAQAKR